MKLSQERVHQWCCSTWSETSFCCHWYSNIFPHIHHNKFFNAPLILEGASGNKIISGGPTIYHNQLICKLTVLQKHSCKQEVADKTHTETGHRTDIYQIFLSPGCKQPLWQYKILVHCTCVSESGIRASLASDFENPFSSAFLWQLSKKNTVINLKYIFCILRSSNDCSLGK